MLLKKVIKIFLFLFAMMLVFNCAASKVVVKTIPVEQKPFTANFLYETGSIKLFNQYYAETGQGWGADLLSTLIASHSFDEQDQANLKTSFVDTLIASKPFKKINFLTTRDELSQSADYDIIVTYFGGNVGGRWTVEILLGYLVIRKSDNKVVSAFKAHIKESSMMKNLNGVKNECIETAIKVLFEQIKKIS